MTATRDASPATPHAGAPLFLIFATGYFLSYFLRSANAVLAPDLQRDAGLGAADLGLMTALFFGAYAAAQVPVGLLLDRWGPRGVAASLMSLGVVGALLFATGGSLLPLAVGRVLLGVGTGSVLLAGLKAFALWWPPQRFATMSGIYFASGSLGALLASSPLAWAGAAFGWRAVFLGAAAVVAAVAATIWWRAPAAPTRTEPRRPAPATRAGPAAAPASRAGSGTAPAPQAPTSVAPPQRGATTALVGIMLLGAAHTAPVLAFQTLWGGPYLYDGFGADAATTGRFLLLLSLGVSLGYAASGVLADRLGLRRVTLAAAVAFAAVQWALAAVTPGVTPLARVWPLYGLLGFTGGFCVLALANARALLGLERSGRATGLVNAASIGAVFATQWAIGGVVEAVGDPSGYRLALAATGALTLAAAAFHAWSHGRLRPIGWRRRPVNPAS